MKIDYEENTVGTFAINAPRIPGDELLLTIYLGDMDEEYHERYIELAEEMLNDNMSDDDVREALDRDIWERLCNE